MSSLRPNALSIEEYLQSLDSKKVDTAKELIAFFEEVTGYPAVMWNYRIVGFGYYRYRYETGRTGEAGLVGFAINKQDIVVYLNSYSEQRAQLLNEIGPHRAGVGCVYFKRLSDLDLDKFKQLIHVVMNDIRTMYPEE